MVMRPTYCLVRNPFHELFIVFFLYSVCNAFYELFFILSLFCKIIEVFCFISMRCQITRTDVLILIIYIYLITDLIINWSAYAQCYKPIQLFLLETYCLVITHRIFSLIKMTPGLPRMWKKCLGFIIYWIFNPGFIYLTVEGIVWQYEDDKNTENCIPIERVPWIVDLWIVMLILIDVLVILISVFKIIKWWRIRVFRRRMDLLIEELSQIDDQALHQILLRAAPGDLNNQIGLTEAEISKIPKSNFSSNTVSIFSFSDSCAICCEEFIEDEEVYQLPGCHHMFHSKCVSDWLIRNPLCPMCRANVRSNLLTLRGQRRNLDSQDVSYDEIL